MLIFEILIIVVFLMLSAFFSGIETGIISIDRLTFEQQAKDDKKKKKILNFLKEPGKIFGTTLFGTNISIVIVSSLTIYIVNQVKETHSLHLSEQTATLIITALILIFAEIIPKAIYRDFPNKLVTRSFSLLNFFNIIFTPFIKFVSFLNSLLSNLLHVKENKDYNYFTREDLTYMLSETLDEDTMEKHQKQMLEEVLEFSELDAENVMIHRTEIIALEKNIPVDEVIKIAKKHGYTRFPVYDNDLDSIEGILIIYDLLQKKSKKDLQAKDFLRKAYFAPENTDIDSLLEKMQINKISMAIVTDSFGGTAGIVTIEDILEEIVGEIEDEYDNPPQEIEVVGDEHYIVQGFVEVDYLNDDYNMELPAGDYETIAGLIINKLEKIPHLHAILEVGKWKIEILQVTNKKILKIEIRRNL